jgi:hypothetical protein
MSDISQLLSSQGMSMDAEFLFLPDDRTVALELIEVVRWRGWTAHRENFLKRTRHGRVTLEWGGGQGGAHRIQFEVRNGEAQAIRFGTAFRDALNAWRAGRGLPRLTASSLATDAAS